MFALSFAIAASPVLAVTLTLGQMHGQSIVHSLSLGMVFILFMEKLFLLFGPFPNSALFTSGAICVRSRLFGRRMRRFEAELLAALDGSGCANRMRAAAAIRMSCLGWNEDSPGKFMDSIGFAFGWADWEARTREENRRSLAWARGESGEGGRELSLWLCRRLASRLKASDPRYGARHAGLERAVRAWRNAVKRREGPEDPFAALAQGLSLCAVREEFMRDASPEAEAAAREVASSVLGDPRLPGKVEEPKGGLTDKTRNIIALSAADAR